MVHPLDCMGCVLIMHPCRFHVCLMCCKTTCLLHLYDMCHGCRTMFPWKVDGVVVECVVMSVWLIMHFLCMLMFTCGQVYSDLVFVVMHELMVCVVDMVMH